MSQFSFIANMIFVIYIHVYYLELLSIFSTSHFSLINSKLQSRNSIILYTIIAKLQIKGGTDDNSKIIFSYFSTKMYLVTPH